MKVFEIGILLGLICSGVRAQEPVADGSLFARAHVNAVRVVAWNTERTLMDTSSASRNAAYGRLLRALDPDVISLEEVVESYSEAQIQARLNALCPLPQGGSWYVWRGLSDGYNRNVLASRYPLSMKVQDTTPASDLRGVCAALVDVPDSVSTVDLYVMGVHLKCCSGVTATAQRQKHADALAKWFGDLRTAGGAVNLPANTPAFAVGDFNLVDPDPQQPEVTLRTGDIQNQSTYGSDIKGDWDSSDLTDLQPADPATGDKDTWPSGTTTPGSRLDRMYFTDIAVTVAKSFVLNSRTLSSAQLTAAGLQAADCETVADHLPIAADLTLPAPPPPEASTRINAAQRLTVRAQGQGYQELRFNYTTSETSVSPYQDVDGSVPYTFPKDEWIGLYHYDYGAAAFTQAIYGMRTNL